MIIPPGTPGWPEVSLPLEHEERAEARRFLGGGQFSESELVEEQNHFFLFRAEKEFFKVELRSKSKSQMRVIDVGPSNSHRLWLVAPELSSGAVASLALTEVVSC